MGWFWETKPSQTSQGAGNDAYHDLDPSLRDFLHKQNPTDHAGSPSKSAAQPSPTSPSTQSETTYRAQFGLDVPGLNHDNQNPTPKSDRPSVPPESLYPDGRYADLWKTYRSQAEIDTESRSDQDKLAGVLEAVRDRKAAIGRAAVENCVEYQLLERDCYRNGSWMDRMTMCRAQNRAFNRCYSMQSRFLKALGYLSSQHTSAADEERIQMHADKLYNEMLQKEEMMEKAKESGGGEVPTFDALIPPDETTKALGEQSAWAVARRKALEEGAATHLSEFPEPKQKEVRERLKNLTEAERQVELQLIAAESRAMREYSDQIEEELKAQRTAREQRRAQGKESFGDTVKRLLGSGNL